MEIYFKPGRTVAQYRQPGYAADVEQLTRLFTAFLIHIRNNTSLGYAGSQAGIWNCEEWLFQAAKAAELEWAHDTPKGKRAGNLTFELHGGQLQVAYQPIMADLANHFLFDSRRSQSKYVGSLVQLTFVKQVNGFAGCWYEARWLAQSPDLMERSLDLDEFQSGNWCFPKPLLVDFLGEAQLMRDWLTAAKLSL